MKLNLSNAANYRDANGNYLGTGRPPNVVTRPGTTLRNLPPAEPTTLRQIVPGPASGRTRRSYGRRT